MITKEQAFAIAKELVPDIDEHNFYDVTDDLPRLNLLLDEESENQDHWCVTYCTPDKNSPAIYLHTTDCIVIDKTNGRVVYHGSITPRYSSVSMNDALIIAFDYYPELANKEWVYVRDGLIGRAQLPFYLLPLEEEFWCIQYSYLEKESDMKVLSCSYGIIVSKLNGRIIYQGDLSDEG